jgi:hypothetical protein
LALSGTNRMPQMARYSRRSRAHHKVDARAQIDQSTRQTSARAEGDADLAPCWLGPFAASVGPGNWKR